MKISVKNIFFALGALALAASCGENSWNDHLEGFEGGVNYNTAIEGEFIMSAADYTAVASNSTNKALAEAAGVANALKAVGSNGMFSAEIPAKEYLPAFLASSSAPYFVAPNGSKVNVTYQETGVTDPMIAAVAGATKYTVSKDDYINAWGSDKDYIDAFAPMTPADNKIPAILKNAVQDAQAGQLAIVSYNESTTNPVFISDSDVEEFVGGTFFLVADGANGAGPVVTNKSYGYLPLVAMTVADGAVTSDEVNAYTFIPAEGGYYLRDAYGRYLFQKDDYKNFNLSTTVPATGGIWTVELASNGQATITNATVGKWIQYDANYSSWGSYDTAQGSLPVLYKAPAPKYYIVTADGHGAGPVTGTKPYGYLSGVAMTVENGTVVNGDPANLFTFEKTTDGWYIKDSYDRYLYQSGTYNNFNLSTEVPESGALWTLKEDSDGNVTITNNEMGKWIQYGSDGYDSWGSYDTEKGTLPMLCKAPVSEVAATRAVAGTPVSSAMTAVYQYNGEKWAPATGVVALNAADYEAMGFAANSLDNADVYLPLFLKANKPYAVAGDQLAVVYNTNKCSILVFDGQNWAINDNELQTRVGQFVKEAGIWRFVKYIGTSYFNLTTELIVDRQYLIVAEGVCAMPLAMSKNYGYLNGESVNPVEGVIAQKNEANAFTFATTAVINDQTYRLTDGNFFIVDSNGRYLYMQGSFNSFNVGDAPAVKDNAVDPAYVFTATLDGDAWKIANVGNGKWIQYSTAYSSWGCYDSVQGTDPALYVLSAE